MTILSPFRRIKKCLARDTFLTQTSVINTEPLDLLHEKPTSPTNELQVNHRPYSKLYLILALHSTKEGHIQYKRCPALKYKGVNTTFSPASIARMVRSATNSRLRPCLFGSDSRTTGADTPGGLSTAEARKAPSMVPGRKNVKLMEGCSMESAR